MLGCQTVRADKRGLDPEAVKTLAFLADAADMLAARHGSEGPGPPSGFLVVTEATQADGRPQLLPPYLLTRCWLEVTLAITRSGSSPEDGVQK